MFEEHRPVILRRPLPALRLQPGDGGVVVHVHGNGDAYEVEFMSPDGRTIGVVTLQAQDLRAAPFDHRHRMTTVLRILRHSMRLFFAPLTGSVRGIWQEYQRIARLESARHRRQAEFVRRGRAAVERSEAARDWTTAEAVMTKLSAKVDEARKHKSPGALNGELAVPPNFDDDLPSDDCTAARPK